MRSFFFSLCFTDASVGSNSDSVSCYSRKCRKKKKRVIANSQYSHLLHNSVHSLLYIISKWCFLKYISLKKYIIFSFQPIIFFCKRERSPLRWLGEGSAGLGSEACVEICVCVHRTCARVHARVKWLCKCPPVVCLCALRLFFFCFIAGVLIHGLLCGQ